MTYLDCVILPSLLNIAENKIAFTAREYPKRTQSFVIAPAYSVAWTPGKTACSLNRGDAGALNRRSWHQNSKKPTRKLEEADTKTRRSWHQNSKKPTLPPMRYRKVRLENLLTPFLRKSEILISCNLTYQNNTIYF